MCRSKKKKKYRLIETFVLGEWLGRVNTAKIVITTFAGTYRVRRLSTRISVFVPLANIQYAGALVIFSNIYIYL